MLRFLLVLKGVKAPRGVKQLLAELLERVNLQDAAKRKVGTYSGGMRQRLGIAQALAGNPRIVVVDEPTAGLDPEERMRFYRLLAELAENRLVLLSTHIVEDISVLCCAGRQRCVVRGPFGPLCRPEVGVPSRPRAFCRAASTPPAGLRPAVPV